MKADHRADRLLAIVDREECFGFGFCVDTLPAVFSFDEAGKSVALDVEADSDILEQAADACPRSAITLVMRTDRGSGPSGG